MPHYFPEHVRRRAKRILIQPTLEAPELAQAFAVEVAYDDFDWFPRHKRRYESEKYKSDLKRIRDTQPLHDYVQGGELPNRNVRLRRVRKFFKPDSGHMWDILQNARLSFEDVADAFKYVTPERIQNPIDVFWKDVIEPPYEPLYHVPKTEVDPTESDAFTPAEALFVLAEGFAKGYEKAMQDFDFANHRLAIGPTSFTNDQLATFKIQRQRAQLDQEKLMPWYLAFHHGTPMEGWRYLFHELNFDLSFALYDKRFADVRTNGLLCALVAEQPESEASAEL